jgi:hypothetical protein
MAITAGSLIVLTTDHFAHQQIHLISHLPALIIGLRPDGLAITAIEIKNINHLGGSKE